MDLPTDLSDAERGVVEHATRGEICQLGTGEPSEGAQWGEERVVRASVIYALCCGAHGGSVVHAKGVRIRGARIEGMLDFQDAVLQAPLHLLRCFIGEPMCFQRARLAVIFLTGSYTHGIRADGLYAKEVVLNNAFCAKGEVRLLDATIGGTLDCTRATFENPEGDALSADRLECKGSVFLTDGFSAKGEVRLRGATIGSNLECTGGTFENPDGYALSADGLECKGDVFLTDGFSAKGQVRLLGATIAGNLDCAGGTFENPDGDALSADGLECKRSVFLRAGFSAKGNVGLINATIRGNLDCSRSVCDGSLDLTGVRVATLWDERESWPARDCLHIDGLRYDQIEPADVETRLDWLKRIPATPFTPQPYTQLAAVLRSRGGERAASEILMAREKARARRGPDPWWLKGWMRLLGVTIGYGYRPGRAVWGLVVVWVLGWNVFSYADAHCQIVAAADTQSLTFHPLLYSLDVLVPVVNLQVEEDWTVLGGWVWWFMRAQIALGWIFSTLAVLGFSGLVRKD